MIDKRFTLKEIDNYNHGRWVTDIILDNGIELPQSTACDLLNKLVTDNRKLLKSNDHLYHEYHKVNNKLHSIEGILEEHQSKKYLSSDTRLEILNEICEVVYDR